MARKIPQRVREVLSEARKELQKIYHNRLKEIILFGSYARGDFMDDLLEKAWQSLEAADSLFKDNFIDFSAGRAYCKKNNSPGT